MEQTEYNLPHLKRCYSSQATSANLGSRKTKYMLLSKETCGGSNIEKRRKDEITSQTGNSKKKSPKCTFEKNNIKQKFTGDACQKFGLQKTPPKWIFR